MTCAQGMCGEALHFPTSYKTDAAGAIVAPRLKELEHIADQVRPDDLLRFIRTLKRARKRRRWNARWAAVNEARLVLMRMCADRAVTEDVPGNVDLALGELRWGR